MLKNRFLDIYLFVIIVTAVILLQSCSAPPPAEETAATEETEQPTPEKPKVVYDTNNPISLVQSVGQTMGGLDGLRALNDVQYDYVYHDMAQDKKDVSVEKYIFSNEFSWASYTTHEVNVAPDLEGEVIQCYNGESAMVSHNGERLEDEAAVGLAHFLRKANYFWFTMMYKLSDPGTVHEYLGQEKIEGTTFDKVSVTYDSAVTGKPVNDMYILYVDPETKMVKRFLFSLPAMNVNEPVLLMEVEYKEMNGIQVPVSRKAYQTDGQGNVTGEAFIVQTLDNIKFNNGFTAEALAI